MSQIKKKYIQDNAIDGSKIKLLNGQTLRATDSSGTDRDLFYFNSSNEWQLSIAPKLAANPVSSDDLARKGYIDDVMSAEQTRAGAAESGLGARLDVVEGSNTTAGSIAKAEKDSKDYADQKIADLVASAPAVLDTLKELATALADDPNFATTVATTIANEQTRAQGAEDSLASDLAQEVSDRQAAVSAEQTRAEAAESSLGADITQEVSDRQAAVSAEQSARESADTSLQGEVDAVESALAQEVSDRQAAVSAEQTRAQGAETTLQSNIDAEQSAREAAMSAEQSRAEGAESGLQSQIDNILSNVDPAALDSLTEIVGAFQNADSDLTTAINNLGTSSASAVAAEQTRAQAAESSLQSAVSAEQSRAEAAESAEQTRAEAAETGLQSNIDAEATARANAVSAEQSRAEAAESSLSSAVVAEASRAGAAEAALDLMVSYYAKHVKELDSTDIMNGYVDLAHEAAESSVVAFVDRLAIHETQDYTISSVAGVTRINLSTMLTGTEAPVAGDTIRVAYAYKGVSSGGGGGGSAQIFATNWTQVGAIQLVGGSFGAQWGGQTFLAPSNMDLTKLEVKADVVGQVEVAIYSLTQGLDVNGFVLLQTVTAEASADSTVTVLFGTPVTLTSGAEYAFVLKRMNDDVMLYGYGGGAGYYADGRVIRWDDSAMTYSTESMYDIDFRLYGNAG